ncbi:MAG: insulinase family protein [Moraxellaceae bacterium]|nr:insulinase family protein [Moraxellaceae bacterium]
MKTTLTPLFISLTLALTACANVPNSEQPTQVIQKSVIQNSAIKTDFVKSANDKRDYAFTELDNGLKLLVISDKDAQRSAVSVDVKVGSSQDPKDYQGLAHFLEHMLFLGTDKYPNPDEFQEYISKHGGSNNAYTAFDNTNYFFDINPKYLHSGLERFARFFVAPQMNKDYVKREREAVNSEYKAKIRETTYRNVDVLKQTVNPNHPYARFNIGRLDTLPTDTVRPELLKFYQKYYSADRMSVVIVGKEDTATLLKWGKEQFSDVPKRNNLGDINIKERLYTGKKLPILIKNQSLKNKKELGIFFPIPYKTQDDYIKTAPYISHILGYEGKGSLLATLKKMGYASELWAINGQKLAHESIFSLGITLTEKGYQNTDKVLAVIFDYIDLLRADNKGKKRYQEIATIAKTAFQFQEKFDASSEATIYANRLNRYPVKDVLALQAIFAGYQQTDVDKMLSLMTLDNAVVQLTAPDIKGDKTTHYFNVPYSIEPLNTKAIQALQTSEKSALKDMQLPPENPFIADDYSLHSDKMGEKQTTLESGIQLYYKNDTSFDVPRSSVQISLQPTAKLLVKEKTAMSLLGKLLNEELNTTLYDASLAGLDGGVLVGNRSLVISLQGYQQKMPNILTKILAQLQDFSVKKATFQRLKTNYKQDLQNFKQSMPYQQTFAYLAKETMPFTDLPNERLAVIDEVDEKAILAVKDKILSSLAVRMMVYGNDTYPQAQALADTIANQLTNSNLQHAWQKNSAIVLDNNKNVEFKTPHADYAITYYIQGENGYSARAKVGLLGQLISAKFFNDLRTDKQLGYIVNASSYPVYNQAGIRFTVQSPVANAEQLQQHIIEFNKKFAQSLATLSEEELAKNKAILKAELLQKPENLITSANYYWGDIMLTDKTISSRQELAKAVDKIELADFVKSMQTLLTDGKHVAIKAEPMKVKK